MKKQSKYNHYLMQGSIRKNTNEDFYALDYLMKHESPKLMDLRIYAESYVQETKSYTFDLQKDKTINRELRRLKDRSYHLGFDVKISRVLEEIV